MNGSGNTFYLRAVWGGADRPNDILGLVWQHSLTEKHCMIKKKQGLVPTDQLMKFTYQVALLFKVEAWGKDDGFGIFF